MTVNFGNDIWYSDTTSDGISESSCAYGDGFSETQRLVWRNTIMARWGKDIYLDDNMDGFTDSVITWGTGSEPYHLADMDGDGDVDLLRQYGNTFYVNTDEDAYTDWWFTYGESDGSDTYYFADIDGDEADDILVQRCLADCNWFLVLYNSSIQRNGAANTNDAEFTYGNGLEGPGVIPPTEDQYLFYDASHDGRDDACVRRYTDTILCDTNGDSEGDVSFRIGSNGASWYAGGSTLCARYGNTFYCDQTADGITDDDFVIGNGGNDDYRFGADSAAVRYGGTTYFDTDRDSSTNFAITWGGTTGWPYYLADMDGDGTVDMIRRDGNTLYVNTNRDIYTDWWFTYGESDGSDTYYFADMDGDGKDDVLIRRCLEACNSFLVLYNSSIKKSGAANYEDASFTYGWGL